MKTDKTFQEKVNRSGAYNDRLSASDGVDITFRQAPHNIEAEQALLGAILINNEAYDRVSSFLEPHHFFDPLHSRIFETAIKLIQGGQRATPVTLKNHFEHEEAIGSLTVPQYLGRLAANATSVINARDYGRTIRDLAARRDLIIIGEDIVNTAYDGSEEMQPSEQIEEAEKRLFSIAERGEASRDCSVADALLNAVAAIATAYGRGGGLSGLPTGFTDLDKQLGGLAPSDLLILAGRPSQGKTALATNIAFNVARGMRDKKEPGEVSFYSLEMSPEQLVMRELAQEIEIPSDRLRRGAISEDEYHRCDAGMHRLEDLAIHIDPTGSLTIPQLMTRARRRKRTHKTRLIIIDYLQLMASGGRSRENKTQEVTQITIGLKALAKELDVPVIALSQLSRQVENRDDKRPQLSDLRESGSIEQDADVVMFVFREEYYVKRREPSTGKVEDHQKWQDELDAVAGLADVIVGKSRHGPVGTVRMAFSEEFTRFSNFAKEKPENRSAA